MLSLWTTFVIALTLRYTEINHCHQDTYKPNLELTDWINFLFPRPHPFSCLETVLTNTEVLFFTWI